MICGSAVLEKFKTLRRAIDCPLKFGPLGKRVLTDKQAAVCARETNHNFARADFRKDFILWITILYLIFYKCMLPVKPMFRFMLTLSLGVIKHF